MLPPHYSGRSPSVLSTRISTICPQAPLQPFFLHYTLAAPASHGCSSKPSALSGGPSLRLLPNPKAQSGRPSSRKHPLTMLCATRKQNISILCLPHGVIICLRLAPPAPLGWKLLKGGPHRPRLWLSRVRRPEPDSTLFTSVCWTSHDVTLSAFIWIFTAAEAFYSWSRSFKWLFYNQFPSLNWLSSFLTGPVLLAFSRDIFLVLRTPTIPSFSSRPLFLPALYTALPIIPSWASSFLLSPHFSSAIPSILRASTHFHAGSFSFLNFTGKTYLHHTSLCSKQTQNETLRWPLTRMLQVQTLQPYTLGPN